ncbi:MAG: Putative peptidoglycan binding domain-containing protein [Candidatus Kentron sp. G]|nr:MAG: Putative peptidoglycan binding domain-containing protein [Candidatus Kentron sp. G]VFM97037.1 MAG: Putative peptidoglycan binding domain-containing protein [Candidatus Kentron sp. G]VFM99351.1 MAG: Putative peptidoglycan binding domain-containing protein [Candidatus Kentron sp. G]
MPCGRWLGASLGGKNGVRVFDAAKINDQYNFRQVFADREYGDNSYGCAFGPDSRRLVTSSRDGRLRLYRHSTEGFKRIKETRPSGGKRPYAVAFHPQGTRIAVGFADTTAVQVVDGRDLTPRYAANTAGIGNGNLGSVAWSADGERLFAGGMYWGGNSRPVLGWGNSGHGARSTWLAADMTVMALKPLPGGRLAVGAGDPALLVFDSRGEKLLDLRPRTADLRGKQGNNFRLSRDGRQVAFGLKEWGEDPVWFDLASRRLERGSASTIARIQARLAGLGYNPGAIDGRTGPRTRAAARAFRRAKGIGGQGLDEPLQRALGITKLTAPRTETPGLAIRDWEDNTNPTLNGQTLALDQYEFSRSLAITPNGERFLLGTEWWLRFFDGRGKELWRRAVPGVAWGVNISHDGRLAVAAFGDGTIRWYRLTDGEPLLSLFVTNDGKANKEEEWVLWSPSGYYDASPGGDRLIGWHVNNGKDALADFYPAAQLRGRFYRPEVVAQVLTELDEDKALAKAAQRPATDVAQGLPPTVALLAPGDGERFRDTRVTVRYRVGGKGDAPIRKLRLLVDGRPLEAAGLRGLKRVKGKEQSLTVTLPARDLALSLIAENRHGASEPATARLVWAGRASAQGTDKTEAGVDGFVIRPKLYVLAIGVSDYEDNRLDLQFAAQDARDFAAVLKRRGPGLYREVEVKTLPDAGGDRVFDGLDWLRAEVTAKDVGILFLAGHGVNDADGDYYFLPRDADTRRLRRTAVEYHDIKKTVSRLPGKSLVFIDTCHSGNIMGARRGVADINAVIHDLASAENGVVVFASSSGRQYSLEHAKWGNGAFTEALVEGIDGKADYTRDDTITINELDLYLSERVKELTRNQQTPVTSKPETIADFPVVAH